MSDSSQSGKTRYSLSKISFAPAAKSNINHIANELIPVQAREHETHIKQGSADIKQRITDPDPAKKILKGGIIQSKSDSRSLAYILISDTHNHESTGFYLEDFMTVPGEQSKGLGTLAFTLIKYAALKLGQGSVSCTVDSNRDNTMRFYTSKAGMQKHPAPLIDIADSSQTDGYLPDDKRDIKVDVKILALDDIDKHDFGNFYSSLKSCSTHPHNFAAFSELEDGGTAVTFANVSTSTFQNQDGVNILETRLSSGRPVSTEVIMSHLFALREEARKRNVDHHVKVKLDRHVAMRRIFQEMSKKCVSHMTEADTHELRFDTRVEDIPGDIDEIPQEVRDALIRAFDI